MSANTIHVSVREKKEFSKVQEKMGENAAESLSLNQVENKIQFLIDKRLSSTSNRA